MSKQKVMSILVCGAMAACANSKNVQETTQTAENTTTEAATTETPAVTETQISLVDTAMKNGNFNTLLTALKAAELDQTLNGNGPYTIFAPTDEAFAKLPADQLTALLADKEKLKAVLTHHVVNGSMTAADVTNMNAANTLNGTTLNIDTNNGVTVNGAKIITTDIAAKNGMIHSIDTVLMPE